MESRTKSKSQLKDRLWCGRGVLISIGDFWYPAHLIKRQSIKTWSVKWWKGCKFPTEGPSPGIVSEVDEDKIIDSLWNCQKARCKIRVSQVVSQNPSMLLTHQL